jgi:medium-chain acyl-[acyl-carrier-protein] hydrolase
VKLYCLPHAGGSANVYLAWRHHLDASLEIVPVELSGRGRRMASPLRDTFHEVLEDVVTEATRTPIPADYAILGHSFGALLAFELAHRLIACGHRAPRHLFISASCAPERVGEIEIVLSDENRELLKSLAYLGGTPVEILADDEAVELFAPILRADLRALFDYRYVAKGRLTSDISILLGSSDTVASEADADLWAKQTSGRASFRVLEGGHFAAFEHPELVASHVNATLLGGLTFRDDARAGRALDLAGSRRDSDDPDPVSVHTGTK